jgi:hypothetical protein
MKGAQLQQSIYDALTGDVTLMALITGVFADVVQPNLPENDANFPYVVIGQDTLSPFDTKTDNGTNALCQIDVWSRQNNLTEAKNVGTAVYDVLQKGSLTISGAHHILTRAVGQAYSTDPDGHTKRGLLTFTVMYDEI